MAASLELIASSVSVLYQRQDSRQIINNRVMAISSLSKLFILLAVLDSAAAGRLRLSQSVSLRQSQLAPLSAGMGMRQVGETFSLAQLCISMVVLSDNTAADILLDMVGTAAVLKTMEECGVAPALNTPWRDFREWIQLAWGGKPGQSEESDLRERASTIVRHHDGLDYFAPLSAVHAALCAISRHSWTPWGIRGRSFRTFQKGAVAPGVLAQAIFSESPNGGHCMIIDVNDQQCFGLLEEAYVAECSRVFAEEIGWSARERLASPCQP
jgi:hypothetical protein